MPSLLADPKLRKAALDPRLLAWTLYRALLWPFLKVKTSVRRYRRNNPRYNAIPNVSGTVVERTRATLRAPQESHVAFTGAGLGEFVMLKRVADRLVEFHPWTSVSYTLRDADAVEAVHALYPDETVAWMHPEAYRSVLRWLAAQRPDVLVLSENYRYPTLLAAATAFGTRAFLMNGRRRERGVLKNRLLSWHHRWMIGMLSGMGMQTEAYARTARTLAPPDCDIQATGDIKTDVRIMPLPPEHDANLRAWLASDLPLVGAGSTDGVEEARMVVEAFARTREAFPCRLLLAPRRLAKLDEILEAIEETGLSYRLRSSDDQEADILVLDTQGELANAYRVCDAVYVGGSYVRGGGGHNVMEPLAWGVPVAYGTQRGNFEAIQKLVEEEGIGTRIAEGGQLTDFWLRFLTDPAERRRVGEIGSRLIEENRGAVGRTVEMIVRLLPATEPVPSTAPSARTAEPMLPQR